MGAIEESKPDLPKVEVLINQDLSGFKVVRMTEVYRTDEDGIFRTSLGFFKDLNVASVYKDQQGDKGYVKTRGQVVLTDGKIGFLLGDSVFLHDDEAEFVNVREKILAKLSPTERSILGV